MIVTRSNFRSIAKSTLRHDDVETAVDECLLEQSKTPGGQNGRGRVDIDVTYLMG